MTKAQERAVSRIRWMAENLHYYAKEDYEIKEWKVEECECFVAVVVEVGMKGDEGTLAQALCRDRAQLFIGTRGGITYPAHHIKKNGEYKFYTKRMDNGLFSVVYDQKHGC